ncbi:MAG: Ni/Fe-hydrogenase cytochrome b subunit [Myxococcota bacterium]|jgi:Ni/Fe-hydrogenase subunit HybB-like protein|nr:Ni/Fe-hydrogenase cytochrome b subunit [Myxococcota bacterium]
MKAHTPARPVDTIPFFTPGVLVLLGIVLLGGVFGVWRLIKGLGAITNLDDVWPWGLWIGVDVATGVALAAGGFTTSALAHIFHRESYHAVVRPALLTAMLGYTFVALGLMFDLGRYYNIWFPIIYWQGNSVLFEVGMCVTAYLVVLYLEFAPIVIERFKDGLRLPGPFRVFNGMGDKVFRLADKVMPKLMWALIIMGVVLSCMHQSSLGSLMLIAPTKVHPLWYTPLLPLFFLMSAVAVGFPMVAFEALIASRSFRLEPEMSVLTPLLRFTPVLLGLYGTAKVIDMLIRGAFVHLDGSVQSMAFGAEMILGVFLPMGLLISERVRRSPGLLFLASALVVGGVALNRVNVFLVGYAPPFATKPYFPSLGEFAITAALISTLVLVYRFVALNFPVIAGHPRQQQQS